MQRIIFQTMIWTLGILLLTTVAQIDSSDSPLQFPRDIQLGNQLIAGDMLNVVNNLGSRQAQIRYLISVAERKNGDKEQNQKKSSAIRLLGLTQDTNAIPILLENLSFIDEVTKKPPAVYALAYMGESAVEPIFDFILRTNDPLMAVRAGEAIQMIKCEHTDCSAYFEWLRPRLRLLPRNVRAALSIVEYPIE